MQLNFLDSSAIPFLANYRHMQSPISQSCDYEHIWLWKVLTIEDISDGQKKWSKAGDDFHV